MRDQLFRDGRAVDVDERLIGAMRKAMRPVSRSKR